MRGHLGRHVRLAAGSGLALLLALGVTGCGGDDPVADPTPTPTPTVSETASPSPTATPTPESPYENDPAVKAARAFAAAVARSINADDRSFRKTFPTLTPAGRKQVPPSFEIELGTDYPGPWPFTPVQIKGAGDRKSVFGCYRGGWALDRKTGKPVNPKRIKPFQFDVARVGGSWKVDAMYSGTHDCKGVAITEVKF